MQKNYNQPPRHEDFGQLFGPGNVPGFLTEGDMHVAIPAVVDMLPDSGLFVEIGGFLGKSTVEWARNMQAQNKKYRICSIDSFNAPGRVIDDLLRRADFVVPQNCETQLDYFVHYTQDYDFVYPVVGFFDQDFCFPAQVDGVFEDSTHTLPYLSHALPFWWEKLRPGGVLSGHDYGGAVRTAVDIFAAVQGVKIHSFDRDVSSIWYIKKGSKC